MSHVIRYKIDSGTNEVMEIRQYEGQSTLEACVLPPLLPLFPVVCMYVCMYILSVECRFCHLLSPFVSEGSLQHLFVSAPFFSFLSSSSCAYTYIHTTYPIHSFFFTPLSHLSPLHSLHTFTH